MEDSIDPGTGMKGDANFDQRRCIDVHSGREKPDDAFAAVSYRDHRFRIDYRDFKSKRTCACRIRLFSLTESVDRGGLPQVTIPPA